VLATSFETVPPRSVLHRFRIPPDNFEFRHTSFLQARSGYDRHIDRHRLKSNWNAIGGSPHFGTVGSHLRLRAPMTASYQQTNAKPFRFFHSFSAAQMKEPKMRRLIAARETFVEIETRETRQNFLAAAIAFPAADTASFITGQKLFVDGGKPRDSLGRGRCIRAK